VLDDKLRDEIIETQRSQSDLTKWKLILIAGIMAATYKVIPGIEGLQEPLPLALIPLVCMFVDIVCFHLGLRILTIARFFRCRPLDKTLKDPNLENAKRVQEYENYCRSNRLGFAMEGYALLLVTLLLSFGVFLVGQYPDVQRAVGLCEKGVEPDDMKCTGSPALAVSGGAGFVLSLYFFRAYKRKVRWLDESIFDQMWPKRGAFALWRGDLEARKIRKILRSKEATWLLAIEKDRPRMVLDERKRPKLENEDNRQLAERFIVLMRNRS
jgi:hypothetical protein